MSDKAVADCANASGHAPQLYVAHAFELRRTTLRRGEHMTAAIATDPCLAMGQSTRIMIYQQLDGTYRRVLDALTLAAFAQVNGDGTVVLPTHESVEVIFESTYVWNGARYVFSPGRSHRFDVALGERRPYQVPVRFAPGAAATTLVGNVAYNFGDDYVFKGRAGQRISIELRSEAGARAPTVSLYYDDALSSLAELRGATSWTGTLPNTGMYQLSVFATDERDEYRRSRYEIRLAIR